MLVEELVSQRKLRRGEKLMGIIKYSVIVELVTLMEKVTSKSLFVDKNLSISFIVKGICGTRIRMSVERMGMSVSS